MKIGYAYPITSFYELQGITKLGVQDILLNPPLVFDLTKVRSIYKNTIRAIPNLAYPSYLPHENGICGFWIRPEDIDNYEEFIDFIEFDADTSDQEKTLLRIYKKDKIWNGNLNFLIKNLNYNVDNRAIPEDLIVNRINCGQRCQENGNCKNCINALAFSNAIRGYKSYLKQQ